MRYLLLIPALCLYSCRSTAKRYIIDIEEFRYGSTLSVVGQHIHKLDTITALNDSAAYAIGMMRGETARLLQERSVKESKTIIRAYGTSYRVTDIAGNRVQFELPQAVCQQIKEEANKAAIQ